MTFTLKRTYAIWSLWISVMTLVVVLPLTVTGDDYTKKYYLEGLRWLTESLPATGVLLALTWWWPLLGTKTRQSGIFFVMSLVVTSALVVFVGPIVDFVMWLQSGGSYDPNGIDPNEVGFTGALSFILFVYIPLILITYLTVGLLVRYKSLKRR